MDPMKKKKQKKKKKKKKKKTESPSDFKKKNVGICRSSGWVWYKAFFRWVWAPGRSLDTPGGSKNTSGPVDILLKKGRLRRQVINQAPPRRVRA